MGLSGIGPVELVIVAAMAAVVLIPVWKILTRMGFSGEKKTLLMVALALLPAIGVCLLLWIVALSSWPALDGSD